MASRLSSLSKPLDDAVSKSSSDLLRIASLSACEYALSNSKLDSELTTTLLSPLRRHEAVQQSLRDQIADLVSSLDEEYFVLLDEAEDDESKRKESYAKFTQARAASALMYASMDDPTEFASEVIYEAAATLDDCKTLIETILKILR